MTPNTCRICLGQGILTNIFQKRGSIKISTKIVLLAKITISPNDGLPNKICSKCLRKLDNCSEFIDMCQVSDSKLRTALSRSSDEENSQTGLEIDFDSENYSLGIEDVNFTECNLLTQNESDNLFAASVKTTKKDESENVNFDDDIHCSKDKKKSVKQQCFTCGKVMSSRFRLKTHLRTHTGERPFSCTHCKKNFSLEQNLKVHMRVHTGEKPLQCNICGESFAQTAGLSAHKRKHTGQTPYQCLLCPRSFRTNGHLQYHVRRHTGEKNFECDSCGKAFITRSGLKQHLLTHSGAKPYECPVCGKRMSRASHVKRHLRHTHKDYLACTHCPQTFTQKRDLDKHRGTHGLEKT